MSSPEAVMGMKVAGGINSTIGSYYAAQGQKTALKAEAGIADMNARLAELTAKSALTSGRREYQAKRFESAALKGSQKVALAANNVALDSGSAVNLLTSSDVMGEIDANTIQANAVMQAWGYRTQGTNYANQALMARANAKAINPLSSALSSGLTAAADVGMTGYKMKKVGVKY